MPKFIGILSLTSIHAHSPVNVHLEVDSSVLKLLTLRALTKFWDGGIVRSIYVHLCHTYVALCV